MQSRAISRRSFVAASAALALSGLAACGTSGSNSSSAAATTTSNNVSSSEVVSDPSVFATTDGVDYSQGTHHATIEVADFGTIEVELYATNAPVTVANFAKLASDGFYDGLTFHRIIKGFMIQGGDPNGDGTGGSSTKIVGEFEQNGHANPIKHERGTISMARANDPDSASSQFFIMHETTESLDGLYAAFGHVTSGMDVVDAICDAVTPLDNNGTIAASEQPKIASIRMVD